MFGRTKAFDRRSEAKQKKKENGVRTDVKAAT